MKWGLVPSNAELPVVEQHFYVNAGYATVPQGAALYFAGPSFTVPPGGTWRVHVVAYGAFDFAVDTGIYFGIDPAGAVQSWEQVRSYNENWGDALIPSANLYDASAGMTYNFRAQTQISVGGPAHFRGFSGFIRAYRWT